MIIENEREKIKEKFDKQYNKKIDQLLLERSKENDELCLKID